jgi:hypothetical protein
LESQVKLKGQGGQREALVKREGVTVPVQGPRVPLKVRVSLEDNIA